MSFKRFSVSIIFSGKEYYEIKRNVKVLSKDLMSVASLSAYGVLSTSFTYFIYPLSFADRDVCYVYACRAAHTEDQPSYFFLDRLKRAFFKIYRSVCPVIPIYF